MKSGYICEHRGCCEPVESPVNCDGLCQKHWEEAEEYRYIQRGKSQLADELDVA